METQRAAAQAQAQTRGSAIMTEFLEMMASRPNDIISVEKDSYILETQRTGIFGTKKTVKKAVKTVHTRDVGGWLIQRATGGKDAQPEIVLLRNGRFQVNGVIQDHTYSLGAEDRVQLWIPGVLNWDLVRNLMWLKSRQGQP